MTGRRRWWWRVAGGLFAFVSIEGAVLLIDAAQRFILYLEPRRTCQYCKVNFRDASLRSGAASLGLAEGTGDENEANGALSGARKSDRK